MKNIDSAYQYRYQQELIFKLPGLMRFIHPTLASGVSPPPAIAANFLEPFFPLLALTAVLSLSTAALSTPTGDDTTARADNKCPHLAWMSALARDSLDASLLEDESDGWPVWLSPPPLDRKIWSREPQTVVST